MDYTQNELSGRRKRDPQLLANERLANGFDGLPASMSWDQAKKIMVSYVETKFIKCVASTLFKYYLNFAMSKAWKIKRYDALEHRSDFICFSSNQTICAEFDISERTLQINNRRLVEAGLICFDEDPNGHRHLGSGVSVLPAFANIRALEKAEFETMIKVRTARFMLKAFSECHHRLMCLIEAGIFPDTYSVETLSLMAKQARKWSRGKLPPEPEVKMAEIKQVIDELEAFAVVACSHVHEDSGLPESGFAHITYKLKALKSRVDAWQEEESTPSATIPDSSADAALKSEADDVALKLPSPDKAVKSIKRLMLARKLPLVDDDTLNDDQILGLYGRRALGEIKLSKPAQTAIVDRFGHRALYIVALQAAHDPKVRHRASWAASFASARPVDGVIDLQSSFYRMIRDNCDHSSAQI